MPVTPPVTETLVMAVLRVPAMKPKPEASIFPVVARLLKSPAIYSVRPAANESSPREASVPFNVWCWERAAPSTVSGSWASTVRTAGLNSTSFVRVSTVVRASAAS
ncbi:hypothetical protein ACFWBV_34725, partial [Streptomyces sp. NPDC060030]|uniref:hypothetical protein n=1 Tax=Streptomyces sp. NPDC060030 TaxID=3347042 RepID=UPI00369098D6